MGFSGKEKGAAQGGRAPPPSPSLIRTRRGGRPPSLSFPPPRIPEGVGLSWRAYPRPAAPPLLVLYIRRQGHPRNTQVDPHDLILSRVRCPLPP